MQAPLTRPSGPRAASSGKPILLEPDLAHLFHVAPAVSGSSRYAALWLALACVTAIVLITPGLPTAVYEPRVSIALGSVSGVVGLALLQLGFFRFKVLRRPIDLDAGLAFGVLAVSSFFAAWAPLSAGGQADPSDRSAYFLLLTRAAAGILFLCGLITTTRQQGATFRVARCGVLGIAAAASLGILAACVVVAPFPMLPSLLDPPARELVASHAPVVFALPGQHVELMLANAVLAIGLLISAIGYTRVGHRFQDPHIGALAGGLIFLFFAQVHTILMPAFSAEYVSSGDAFRFVAYALLLSTLMWRTAQEFAASASQNERLRLSRELHDGLAQQLAILRLRLGQISEMTEPSDPRSRDLEVAQVVLVSACIEARAAIAALRSERIPWSDFEAVLLAFIDEFSLRHDVDARLCTDSSDTPIDSDLKVDVLRIVAEASSNAARHGHASHIEVSVRHQPEGLWVIVSDDGRGFDPARVRRGLGLRSMTERAERRGGSLAVNSAEGHGTTIEAHLHARATHANWQ